MSSGPMEARPDRPLGHQHLLGGGDGKHRRQRIPPEVRECLCVWLLCTSPLHGVVSGAVVYCGWFSRPLVVPLP
uniref:Uncharacterized protein n=1 Tax=Arundo donax TaxID=35708 RepID=A0A0A9CTI6_ARUDO